MDILMASKLLDKHIQQAEAVLALRDILAVAKNTDRLSREAEVVLKRRQETIAQADARIAELLKNEAVVKARADKIIKDAVDKAAATSADAVARFNADEVRRKKAIADLESLKQIAMQDLEKVRGELAVANKELRQARGEKMTAINEKANIVESMKKLAGTVR